MVVRSTLRPGGRGGGGGGVLEVPASCSSLSVSVEEEDGGVAQHLGWDIDLL